MRPEDQHYLGERYKREVLEHMSIAQLIDTIMINPTVHISPSYRCLQGLQCTWAASSSASHGAHLDCLPVTGMSVIASHLLSDPSCLAYCPGAWPGVQVSLRSVVWCCVMGKEFRSASGQSSGAVSWEALTMLKAQAHSVC